MKEKDSMDRQDEPPDPMQDSYDDPDDVTFARAVAAPLRATEWLRPEFDDRMRSALRAEHATPPRMQRPPHWWHRPVTLTAGTVFAVATALTGVVSVTTLVVARTATHHVALQQETQSIRGSLGSPTSERIARAPQNSSSGTGHALPSSHDTVYIVRFVFTDAQARQVSLVGDFNGWSKHVTPLRVASRPGVWSVDVPLRPGRHEYAFVMDGKRWSPDPAADRVSDDFGTESSVVVVGADGRSPSSSL